MKDGRVHAIISIVINQKISNHNDMKAFVVFHNNVLRNEGAGELGGREGPQKPSWNQLCIQQRLPCIGENAGAVIFTIAS